VRPRLPSVTRTAASGAPTGHAQAARTGSQRRVTPRDPLSDYYPPIARTTPPLHVLLDRLDKGGLARVPGTAVFLTTSIETPPVLAHHVARNKALQQNVFLLTAVTEHVPRVPEEQSVDLRTLDKGFHRLIIHAGFMQQPNVPRGLMSAATKQGLAVDFDDVTYYIGRETLLATSQGRMGSVTESIFAFMSRNASRPTAYFGLPPNQVVELGIQLDL
jgi:KUP system potassium uptake protein